MTAPPKRLHPCPSWCTEDEFDTDSASGERYQRHTALVRGLPTTDSGQLRGLAADRFSIALERFDTDVDGEGVTFANVRDDTGRHSSGVHDLEDLDLQDLMQLTGVLLRAVDHLMEDPDDLDRARKLRRTRRETAVQKEGGAAR